MVAINTWVTARELGYILKHADAAALIMSDRFLRYDYVAMLGELEPHAETLPQLRQLVHLGTAGYRGSLPFAAVFDAGAHIPDDVVVAAGRNVQPRDVAYLLYTSGSTSTPKGVQIQHFGLIENMFHIGERMHVTCEDRLWLAVSLYWGLGCENALFNLLTHGGCVVLQEHFEPGEALRIIEQERCTLFYGTPNMAQAMMEHPDRPRRDLSCLRSGGTVGSPEQIRRVMELGAQEICHIYGLTETYGNCAVVDGRLDPPEKRLTTVGRPLDGVDMRIVDPDTQAPRPAGAVGEVQVKGYVTIGYYKDEEKNRAAFTPDGYFRTGDLGVLDVRGIPAFSWPHQGNDQDGRDQRGAGGSGGNPDGRHRRADRVGRWRARSGARRDHRRGGGAPAGCNGDRGGSAGILQGTACCLQAAAQLPVRAGIRVAADHHGEGAEKPAGRTVRTVKSPHGTGARTDDARNRPES